MTPEEFQKYYPKLLGWIDVTLKAHAATLEPSSRAGFLACRFTSTPTH